MRMYLVRLNSSYDSVFTVSSDDNLAVCPPHECTSCPTICQTDAHVTKHALKTSLVPMTMSLVLVTNLPCVHHTRAPCVRLFVRRVHISPNMR